MCSDTPAAAELPIGHALSNAWWGDPPARITFMFLGRKGSFGQFVSQFVDAAMAFGGLDPSFVVAQSGPLANRFRDPPGRDLQLVTYRDRPCPDLLVNLPAARKSLVRYLAERQPEAVVTLMPHVWTPLLAPAIRRLGIAYVTIVHDAAPHPGDPTAFLTPWLLRDGRHANVVVTLSQAVARRLCETRYGPARITALFHPDLHYGGPRGTRLRRPSEPLRLLVFGRLLKYKGLVRLLDAVERLLAEGIPIRLGLAGAGPIGDLHARLSALKAEVINRWIEDSEVAPLFGRYDAVALAHLEASQSGVAAIAHAYCMPVVAVPVGGLVEQVIDGQTGVLARAADTASLAEAIRTLTTRPALYASISRNLAATAERRSMRRFVAELVATILSVDKARR